MRLPRSLSSLTIAFLVPFLAAVAGTGGAIYNASRLTITTLVDQRIAAVSDEVIAAGARGGAPAMLAQIDALGRQRDTGDIGFELKDAANRRVGGNVAVTRALPFGASSIERADRIRGLSEGRALVRPAGGGYVLATVAETEPIDGYPAAHLRNYLVGFGAIVLIVIAGTITFAVMIARRIAALRRTAEAIIDGDLRARVPVDPVGGAFADQAETFNRMLDRIAALMGEIRGVSHDVAHDLRTPLARLRSRLALIAARTPAAPLRADLDDALAQCDSILSMFSATLRIAEIEGGDRRAGFAPVDLGALVAEIAEMMVEVAAESGHRLHVPATPPPLPVTGDHRLLAQAIINLIENALRHTPPGSTIAIGAMREAGSAIVTVTDDGPGIPAADRALALRRFGRLDRSRHVAGHGLGLPLVDAVARLHCGSLSLEDAGPGLRARLTIPIAS